MRRVTEQGATSLSPRLHRLAVVNGSFDDGGRVGPADHFLNRLGPVREPIQQLRFGAVRLVMGHFVLVRSAPPGGAARTDGNKAHPNTQAECLGQYFADTLFTNAAPTLIAAPTMIICGFVVMIVPSITHEPKLGEKAHTVFSLFSFPRLIFLVEQEMTEETGPDP